MADKLKEVQKYERHVKTALIAANNHYAGFANNSSLLMSISSLLMSVFGTRRGKKEVTKDQSTLEITPEQLLGKSCSLCGNAFPETNTAKVIPPCCKVHSSRTYTKEIFYRNTRRFAKSQVMKVIS